MGKRSEFSAPHRWTNSSRRIRITVLAAAAMAFGAPSSFSLEKSRERVTLEQSQDWNLGLYTCEVHYYNICTGWVWVWGGWNPDDRIGTVFDACINQQDHPSLRGSSFHFQTGAPASYGYTGKISIHEVDSSGCPTSVLREQPLLPSTGWNYFVWEDPIRIPLLFAQVITLADDRRIRSPVFVSTDGPWGCGTCFPENRMGNSYIWGPLSSPLCPGTVMNDWHCDVEFLAGISVEAPPISIDGTSWGAIKAIYR